MGTIGNRKNGKSGGNGENGENEENGENGGNEENGENGKNGEYGGVGGECVSVCVYVFFCPSLSIFVCVCLPPSAPVRPLSLSTSYICLYPPVCLSMLISLFLCVSKPHLEVPIYQ